jgi:hexosaminidase
MKLNMNTKIKFFAIGTLLCLLAATAFSADTNDLAVIPWPQKVTLEAGVFKLTPDTRVYVNLASRDTATFLTERLRQSTGYPLKTHTRFFSGKAVKGAILLTTKDANTKLGSEGYALTVTPDSVVIRAPTQAGLFYGVQTLFQLLPPQIFSSNVVRDVDWQMPCVQIEDWPRFKWRGFMLDVSRHFYNKAEVEQVLDEMALQKLNCFHWHLTDDQGWRIQIKKYPKLTEIGAWRTSSVLAPPGVKPADLDKGNMQPAWTAPSADKFGPNGRYGGFYTEADIREVVKYAAARHIMIVPEIEMPGHCVAALAAYPQFGCGLSYSTDVDAGVNNGVFDPSNPTTFRFLDNVLDEIFKLFPGPYIHIGGDEVSAKVKAETWGKSPSCLALMKREGLKNTDELQDWFERQMEKYINAHGKRMVGWSEIANSGVSTNAVIMDWIGGGLAAARSGHDAVMTPVAYCYFDHYQSRDIAAEPHAIGGYLPLEKVYSFEPVPGDLPPSLDPHILGGQANLWTEYIASLAYVQYMIFPRLTALAEVDWSPQSARNFADFSRRLQVECKRFDELGINYHRGSVDAAAATTAQ